MGAVATLDRLGSGGGIDPAAGLIVVALAHGVVLAVLVSALGAVSGAHFNPAVTFAVWLGGQMPWRRAPHTWSRSSSARSSRRWSLRMIFTATVSPTLGTPALGSGIGLLGGIVVEAS